MSPTPTFTTAVLGQTENALNAILERRLDGAITERQWVALVLTAMGAGAEGRDALVARVTGALKVSEAQAQADLDALVAAEFVTAGSPVGVTDAGSDFYDRIRADVTAITARMWGDLPAADLDTAGRVLSTILERANAELARA
jgi:hypothetical protein